MSRSLSYLRRGLLGAALVGSLGFGVDQAFADVGWPLNPYTCTPWDDTENERCSQLCRSQGAGYGSCDAVFQECVCYPT